MKATRGRARSWRRPARRLAPRMRARTVPMRGPKRPKVPAGVNKRRKLKVPRRPKGPKVPNGPQVPPFELLQDAVTTLKEAGVASLAQIQRQLQQKYGWRITKASSNLLATALQRLAERGKVIKKEGCKYRFNGSDASNEDSATSLSGTSRSGTKNADSHTTAASSTSVDTGKSPKDAADGEGRSSTGDLSTSASSTASRAPSKRR